MGFESDLGREAYLSILLNYSYRRVAVDTLSGPVQVAVNSGTARLHNGGCDTACGTA